WRTWADMVDNFQAKALNTRLRVPLLYGVDAVHGHNNVLGATIFPHHVGLGAAGDATLVEAIAAAVAKEVAATGVRWTFAPAVTVCLDPRWGRCYESYGANPGLVTELAIAEIRGWMKVPPEAGNFPGNVFMAPTAKHYVGDGGTRGGVDRGETVGGEAELRKVHLLPYVAAVAEGVSTIMASYSSWNGTKMHGNGRAAQAGSSAMWAAWCLTGRQTQILRTPTRFTTLSPSIPPLVTLHPSPPLSTPAPPPPSSYLLTDVLRKELGFVGLMVYLLTDVLRKELGFTGLMVSDWEALKELPGSYEDQVALGVALGVALVAGRAASLTYIGYPPEDDRYENGTRKRPLEATREAAAAWAKRARSVEADLGIIVVGEPPYAEYKGDDQQLELSGPARSTIFGICGRIPCVVVVVSGRPLNVTGMLPHLDALIAAWLPGSEGGGVADVLFDEVVDFKGKLPLPWFRSVRDLQPDHSWPNPPLFPMGFGLSKAGELIGNRVGGEGPP
ncbi:unnamed protein product, partial [Closterium sp. Naga37s-1]